MSATTKSVNEDVSIERKLHVQLTKEELRERGQQMSAAELKIEQLKMDRKPINTAIREQVERRNELAHVIKRGEEMRVVICKWIAFERENRWSLVRQDTGEEVEARAMTAADRQVPLNFEAVATAVSLEPLDIDLQAPLLESRREQLAAAIRKPRAKPAPKPPTKGKKRSLRSV